MSLGQLKCAAQIVLKTDLFLFFFVCVCVFVVVFCINVKITAIKSETIKIQAVSHGENPPQ